MKNTTRAVLATAGAMLAGSLLSGCSILGNYSGDTCDGQKPVPSMEQAGRELVAAAHAADRDGVCRVTHPFPGGELDDAMVEQTRELLTEAGITPQNVVVHVGERMGSGVGVRLVAGTGQDAASIEVGGTIVREAGYTISLPHEVYPEVPEHPASQSASVPGTESN